MDGSSAPGSPESPRPARELPPLSAAHAALGKQATDARKAKRKVEMELIATCAIEQHIESLSEAIGGMEESGSSAAMLYAQLRQMQAEAEGKALAIARAAGTGGAPSLSTAASVASSAMLIASEIDAAHASIHALTAHLAELRGIAEYAAALARPMTCTALPHAFPYMLPCTV